MSQVGASFHKRKVSNILLPDIASIVEHDLPQSPGVAGNALIRCEFGLPKGVCSVQPF
jgi:hypothetical protein